MSNSDTHCDVDGPFAGFEWVVGHEMTNLIPEFAKIDKATLDDDQREFFTANSGKDLIVTDPAVNSFADSCQ